MSRTLATEIRTDAPQAITVPGVHGPITWRQWNSGPRIGESEREFRDGTKIHYTPDGRGGQFTETTGPNTHTQDWTRPDGKGGAILEHTDLWDSRNNYKVKYSNTGSLTVDYEDGRRLERCSNGQKITTTMTGPRPEHNFTATEFGGVTLVNYNDGSTALTLNGNTNVTGRFGNILDKFVASAADNYHAGLLQLMGAYYLSQNTSVMDVLTQVSI